MAVGQVGFKDPKLVSTRDFILSLSFSQSLHSRQWRRSYHIRDSRHRSPTQKDCSGQTFPLLRSISHATLCTSSRCSKWFAIGQIQEAVMGNISVHPLYSTSPIVSSCWDVNRPALQSISEITMSFSCSSVFIANTAAGQEDSCRAAPQSNSQSPQQD